MTAHELVNTFKYMGSLVKASALSIKNKNQDIDKYKKIILKLSKCTFFVIITSYVIIFKELFYPSLEKSKTDGDIVANAIFSALLSVVLSLVAIICYTIVLITLWLLYLVWKLAVRKKPKHKKNKTEETEPNDQTPIIIDVAYEIKEKG